MSIVVQPPAGFKYDRPKPLPGETLQEYHERCRAWRKADRPKPPRKRRQSTPGNPAIWWLKKLICPHIYWKATDDGPRPNLEKSQFLGRGGKGYALRNDLLLDHFAGRRTLYFAANSNRSAENILIKIEADVQKARKLGSVQGGIDFMEDLRRHDLFKTLYYEPSTHGKGQHSYIVVRKPGRTPEEVKAALNHLQDWLHQRAKGFDIENVEVKGHPMVRRFNEYGWVESVKYGTAAKLPRDISRFEEWKNTSVLTLDQIWDLPLEEVRIPEAQEPPEPVDLSKLGSISGKIVSAEELADLPRVERFFKTHMPEGVKALRWAVTAEDCAQAFVLLHSLTENGNANGTMPGRRIGALWTALYQAGDFARGWNPNRFQWIRDWFSSMGWLQWDDHRFFVGELVEREPAKRKRGIACKWHLHEFFLNLMRGGPSSVITRERLQGPGEYLKPERHWLDAENHLLLHPDDEELDKFLCAA